MTIEQKAKAYDEVVNKLRRFIAQGIDPLITRADVQDFFTELKESEDEKAKEEIKQLIQCMHDADPRKERCLAWLEKQGDDS